LSQKPQSDAELSSATPSLFDAISRKDAASLRQLIEEGAYLEEKTNGKYFNEYGFTPLIFAARDGWEEGVRLLLDAGADLKASSVEVYGMTVFQRNAQTWAHIKGYKRIEDMLRAEQERRAKLAEEKRLEKTLTDRVAAGDCEKVRALLDQAFWERLRLPLDWKHLHIALQNEDVAMTRLLVTYGTNLPSEKAVQLTEEQLTLLRRAGMPLTKTSKSQLPGATSSRKRRPTI
jgi:hypothetical protein